MTAADFLLEKGDGGAPAIVADDRSITRDELREAAAKVAGALAELGLEPGDRVGIVGRNSFFWVASYLAAIQTGLVAVPFPVVMTEQELSLGNELVGCRALLADRRQLRMLGAAIPESVPRLTDELLERPGPRAWPAPPPGFDPDSDAVLMFTSGTTARPRAVRVTHRNIQANTSSIIACLGLDSSDSMLVILPFFYCFGTSLLHTHLRIGGSVVLSNAFVFPETSLDLMERTGCTGFAGVPSSYQHLLRLSTFARRRLPRLRSLQQAGGKLHDILIRELRAACPGARLNVMYGATEATARLSCLDPAQLDARLGSVGRGIPGVELRVLAEDGSAVGPGGVGEIVARGENISPGYFRDPEATAAKFRGGALHTGDLATVDADGYMFIVDRRDDFIKSWGYRVSSQEVESAILELADVVSAAAVGVPSLEAGESIHAFVTLRPGSDLNGASIAAHCRGRLARHMVPEAVTVVSTLPLNANGKVVKSELRRLASP